MKRVATSVIAAFAVILAVATSAYASSSSSSSSTPKRGGSLTVLYDEGEWPTLDPAGPGAQPGADVTEFGPIYGQLFMAGPNDSIVPSEAEGYKFSNNNKTVDITIRPGIKFQDGTPFTASAVAASINRDLAPSTACSCASNFTDVTSVTAPSKYDVRLQLSTADAAIISVFLDYAPNYTVSPTALAKMGEVAFGADPVGAGPFQVVSNEASAKLVLARNPHYFVPGQPYLNNLTILSTSSDQSDFDALETGAAQLARVTTVSVYEQAKSTPGLATHTSQATGFNFVRLNTTKAPFNNPTAREAVEYATNAKSIANNLYGGAYKTTESFEAPGELYYEPNVQGYKAFNLAKAKSLVKSIPGGLTVTLATTNNTPAMQAETEALAAQWEAAGITVNIQVNTLATTITDLENGNWQGIDGAWNCGVDPATCVPLNFASYGEFTGVKDPTLDTLLVKAGALASPTARAKLYAEVYNRIDTEDYVVPLYSTEQLFITRNSIEGFVPYPTQAGYEDFQTLWIK